MIANSIFRWKLTFTYAINIIIVRKILFFIVEIRHYVHNWGCIMVILTVCASTTIIRRYCDNDRSGRWCRRSNISVTKLNVVGWSMTQSSLLFLGDQMKIHVDVIKWQHFPLCWPFVGGIYRSRLKSPHKGQWRGALVFSLICPE